MPELPEVETVRLGLEPVLAGARLARVETRRAGLRFAFPEGFVQRLTGARIPCQNTAFTWPKPPFQFAQAVLITFHEPG